MKFSKLKSFISFCSYGFTFLLGTYVSIPEMGTNKNSLFFNTSLYVQYSFTSTTQFLRT